MLYPKTSTMRPVVSMSWVVAVALAGPMSAQAQQPAAPRVALQPAATRVALQPAATRVAQQPAVARTAQRAAAPAAPATDPYGFTAWLNATRAQYGLGPVGYDPNLTNWAAVNNAQQQARGMGHFVMGPARRQNAAMGPYGTIGSMWLNSPGHRAALLDPTIRWIGIAGLGAYWTFNAY